MPRALKPGQFSMAPKFSTNCFHSSLAIVLNKRMKQTLLQLFHPHFQMHVHQNNVMAQHMYTLRFSIRTLLKLPSKPCKQSIAKCPLKFTFHNIEKKNSKK